MINVNLNGMDVQGREGETILEVASREGLYIPTLCHHPDLSTFGGCRVCMVEANGKIVTACRAPIWDGMVIKTDTPKVRQVRLTNVELLMANHNKQCQTCSRNNSCQLQEVSAYVGITPERMARLRRKELDTPADDSNPFFYRDFSKCIMCGICIRSCQEINGIAVLDFAFRGYDTAVSVSGDKPLMESKCESCGECLVRCPTGALAYTKIPLPERKVKTVCSYCGVGCGVELGVRGDQIVSVDGDRSSPVNHGELCVKGRFGFNFINHPERLKMPLVKKNGKFEETSWDEALELVASKFNEIREKHGPGVIGGASSARCTVEENYLFQKLLRAQGTNNIDHCARL